MRIFITLFLLVISPFALSKECGKGVPVDVYLAIASQEGNNLGAAYETTWSNLTGVINEQVICIESREIQSQPQVLTLPNGSKALINPVAKAPLVIGLKDNKPTISLSLSLQLIAGTPVSIDKKLQPNCTIQTLTLEEQESKSEGGMYQIDHDAKTVKSSHCQGEQWIYSQDGIGQEQAGDQNPWSISFAFISLATEKVQARKKNKFEDFFTKDHQVDKDTKKRLKKK